MGLFLDTQATPLFKICWSLDGCHSLVWLMLLSPSGPFALQFWPPFSHAVRPPRLGHLFPMFTIFNHICTFTHPVSVPGMSESTTCEALLDPPSSRPSPNQTKSLGRVGQPRPVGQSGPLPVFIKFYWDTTMPIVYVLSVAALPLQFKAL